MASPNSSFPAIVASTIKNYSPTMVDNIMNNERLFMYFQQKGLIKEEVGGTSIVRPLLINKNDTVGSYSDFDVLNRSQQDPLSAAEFAWKQVYGSLSFSGFEQFQNQGKSKIVSLLAARTKQLEISFGLYYTDKLYADGSGNGGKDIGGLALYVENGAAWSVCGGIDSNTWAFWRNQWTGSAGSFRTSKNGLNLMRTMYNKCTRGNSTPKLIITTQDLFEGYEAELDNQLRLLSTADNDLGFPTLMYKGTPVTWCEKMPAGTMYFLNPEFMDLTIGKGRNMSIGELQKASSQDAWYADVFMILNMTISNRARQGVIDGFTS